MPLVNANCTNCGATLEVDNAKEAAICPYCNTAYIVEKAINHYNTSINISNSVVNIISPLSSADIKVKELLDKASMEEKLGNHRKSFEWIQKAIKEHPQVSHTWVALLDFCLKYMRREKVLFQNIPTHEISGDIYNNQSLKLIDVLERIKITASQDVFEDTIANWRSFWHSVYLEFCEGSHDYFLLKSSCFTYKNFEIANSGNIQYFLNARFPSFVREMGDEFNLLAQTADRNTNKMLAANVCFGFHNQGGADWLGWWPSDLMRTTNTFYMIDRHIFFQQGFKHSLTSPPPKQCMVSFDKPFIVDQQFIEKAQEQALFNVSQLNRCPYCNGEYKKTLFSNRRICKQCGCEI